MDSIGVVEAGYLKTVLLLSRVTFTRSVGTLLQCIVP